MASNNIIVISPELKKLIDEVPIEQLRPGPKRYAPMRESAKGSWRYILYGGEAVALAWTDWENGFDIIPQKEFEGTDRLSNYPITAKALDIPAGWAYSSIETVVSKYGLHKEVTLSDQINGKLGDILHNEETVDDTEEELENGTE
jgi:hypothetical protein